MHAELDITIRRILHVREKECQVDLLVNAARDQRLDSRERALMELLLDQINGA